MVAMPAKERERRVDALGAHAQRVLVCTDCLSEGINLQHNFDAVMHYDLSWNPTRHEQREGRVDRYGQPRDKVQSPGHGLIIIRALEPPGRVADWSWDSRQ